MVSVADLSEKEKAILESLTPPDTQEVKQDVRKDWDRDIIGAILTNEDFAKNARRITAPEHFIQEAHQIALTTCYAYLDKYGKLPHPNILWREIGATIAKKGAELRKPIEEEVRKCLSYVLGGHTEFLRDKLIKKRQDYEFKAAFNETLKGITEGKADWGQLKQRIDTIQDIGRQDSAYVSMDAIEFFDYAKTLREEFLIGDWLKAGCLTLFSAEQKTGKSTLNFSIISAIANGTRWHEEFAVSQAAPVIYFDYENPPPYVYQSLVRYLPEDEWEAIKDRVYFPTKLPKAITADFVRGFMEYHKLTEHKRGLIIIDSARRAFNGLFSLPDWENKSSEVDKAMRPLQDLARQTGWSVLVVHHNSKAGTTAGSADWEAVADYVWRYRKLDETRRELSTKGRLLKIPVPIVFTWDSDMGRVFYEGTLYGAREQQQVGEEVGLIRVLPVLKPEEANLTNTLSIKEIAEALPTWSMDKIRDTLMKLVGDQRISRDRFGGSAREPYRFYIPRYIDELITTIE